MSAQILISSSASRNMSCKCIYPFISVFESSSQNLPCEPTWRHRMETFSALLAISAGIELLRGERELWTIPLEPLVVLRFSQRPRRRWQIGTRRFHNRTCAASSTSSTDTAARRGPVGAVNELPCLLASHALKYCQFSREITSERQ